MSTSAKVRYNSENERTSVTVNADRSVGLTARFNLEGSTALLTSVEPVEGENCIYGDNLQYVMEYVSELPFITHVLLDEYDENQI